MTNSFTTHEKETPKMLELLRRVYNQIEMQHLNDHKMNNFYNVRFDRGLGEDLFNYLQSKDQAFRDTTIKRQKRYRKRMNNTCPIPFDMVKEPQDFKEVDEDFKKYAG